MPWSPPMVPPLLANFPRPSPALIVHHSPKAHHRSAGAAGGRIRHTNPQSRHPAAPSPMAEALGLLGRERSSGNTNHKKDEKTAPGLFSDEAHTFLQAQAVHWILTGTLSATLGVLGPPSFTPLTKTPSCIHMRMLRKCGKELFLFTNEQWYDEHIQKLNEEILDILNGDFHIYLSDDSIDSTDDAEKENFPIEFLNSINPSGMLYHKLKLNVGAIIMLLRNINSKWGLYNGTRFIIKRLEARCTKIHARMGLPSPGCRHRLCSGWSHLFAPAQSRLSAFPSCPEARSGWGGAERLHHRHGDNAYVPPSAARSYWQNIEPRVTDTQLSLSLYDSGTFRGAVPLLEPKGGRRSTAGPSPRQVRPLRVLASRVPQSPQPPSRPGPAQVQASLGWWLLARPPEAQVTRAGRGLRCQQWQQQRTLSSRGQWRRELSVCTMAAGGFRKAWGTGGQPASPPRSKAKAGDLAGCLLRARPFESLRSAGGFRKAWGTGGQPARWCTRLVPTQSQSKEARDTTVALASREPCIPRTSMEGKGHGAQGLLPGEAGGPFFGDLTCRTTEGVSGCRQTGGPLRQ
ncbi:hypothetical protein QTO34_006615, partial [Cnephaeus nilssonii]